MKISAVVKIQYRSLPNTNNRGVASTLTIGKYTPPRKELFIIHESPQRARGFKYKVNGNIEAVFTRFLDKGKATIRFKVPEHDLIINANPVEIKAFTRLLKLGLEGKLPLEALQLSTLCSTKDDSVPKQIRKSLTVIRKSDYPTITGFPRSLEILRINNIEMKFFDKRILRLQRLLFLDLSDNKIPTLPHNLGCMASLRELYLSDNKLGCNPDWSWMKSSNIANLRLLDLDNNELTFVPNEVGKLKNLLTLSLNKNKLTTLPNSIGNLKKLMNFTVNDNLLKWLPGSIIRLRLNTIDFTGNCFSNIEQTKMMLHSFPVSSLLDLCAKRIITSGIQVSEEVIPHKLIEYLDYHTYYCICGSLSFTSAPTCFVPYDLYNISSSITISCLSPFYSVPIQVKFCSFYCYRKFLTTQA